MCKNCCKKCPDCPNCYDLNIEKIREYLYLIDEKIVEFSYSKLCKDEWGYGCKPVKEEDYEKLNIFKDSIGSYFNSLKLGFNSGICPNEIQQILEATSKLITPKNNFKESYSNVEIEEYNFESWVLNNPYCIAWEDWEKYIPKICPKFGIEVINITNTCNFIYDVQIGVIENKSKLLYTLSVQNIAQKKSCVDIKVKQLLNCKIDYTITSNKIRDCKLDYDLFITKHDDCKIDYEVFVQLEKCRLDYEVLVKKYDCKFNFDTYVSLLKCNLSQQVIINLLDCNAKLDYSIENKCPMLITKNGKYKFSDINVNLFDEKVDKTILKSTFNLSEDETNIQNLIDSYTDSQFINLEINE